MKRLKDDYLQIVCDSIPLADKEVLEIGCGTGTRSIDIAQRCQHLTAIDPNLESIEEAKRQDANGAISYSAGQAEELLFADNSFDVAVYTLSFHHVPPGLMEKAIAETVRVTKKDGYIIFVEPAYRGTFFEADARFGSNDGDERKEKACAYYNMLNSPLLKEQKEAYGETVILFDSYEDFVASIGPTKHLNKLQAFLEQYAFTLSVERRVNFFRPVKIG